MRQTPLSQLIELKLGVDLRRHLLDARAEGKDWRSIAADLTTTTGVSVSHEAVRNWLADELDQPIEATA